MSFASLCLTLLPLAAGQAARVDKLEPVEVYDQRALAARQKIISAEVQASVVCRNTPGTAPPTTWKYNITHRWEGDKILEIRMCDFGHIRQRRIVSENTPVPKYGIFFLDDGKGAIPAKIAPIRPIGEPGHPADPRWIGYTLDHYLHRFAGQLNGLVGAKNSAVIGIARDKLDDLDTIRIDRAYNTGTLYSYWIAPSKDYNIVRMDGKAKAYQWSMRCTLQYLDEAKVWVPVECTDETICRGQLHARYTTTLTWKNVNQPLGDAPFAIPAMGLPAGTVIANLAPDQTYLSYWDGRSVIEGIEPKGEAPKPVFSAAPQHLIWLWRSAIFFGVLTCIYGIYLVYRQFRSPPVSA